MKTAIEFLFNGEEFRANFFGVSGDWALDEVEDMDGVDVIYRAESEKIISEALNHNPDWED
jgi:hypothetical protein